MVNDMDHYVPSLEEITAAKSAGMTDTEIIKLCKEDSSGDWFKANHKSMINKGVIR